MESICWIPAILARYLMDPSLAASATAFFRSSSRVRSVLNKDHLPAHFPGHLLGFVALFLIDVQPDGHQAVGGGGNGRSPADTAGGPGDHTDMSRD